MGKTVNISISQNDQTGEAWKIRIEVTLDNSVKKTFYDTSVFEKARSLTYVECVTIAVSHLRAEGKS